jgi:putative oxygen-independent coproporphyrinogen III oxidase
MVFSSSMMQKKPLAIYIHWPFCLSKCPYCDFNSHVRDSIDIEKWTENLLQDLRSFQESTKEFEVSSIFFGGGTPSLMPPSIVDALLNEISNIYSVASQVEITLEANPNSVEVEKFQVLSSVGINRLSLGIQSLVSENLKFLGRSHSKEEALKAIEISDIFFKNRSFDLIYTLPHQSLTDWQEELTLALKMAGPHLSLYQLTIEEGTPFYLAAHRKDFNMPSCDESSIFFEWTHGFMKDSGYPAYEVSNFARTGKECQHNKHYWLYDDYIGIGPGAHSRLTIDEEKYAIRRHRSPEKWMEMVEKNQSGLHEKKLVEGGVLIEEYLMMRLRLLKHLSFEEFELKTGKNLFNVIPEKIFHLLQKEELLEMDKGVYLTFEGLKKLNSILTFLLDNRRC